MTDHMPDSIPPSNSAEDIDADAVIAWLKEHPDFLQKNPDVIDVLIPAKPKATRGGVADFQSYVIDRLKAEKNKAEDVTREIVETARNNMNSQTRIHAAILRLLEADSFDEFIQTITSDLTNLLDVDITTLVVEADGRQIPHIVLAGIHIVPEGTVDKWMGGKNSLLQDNISGIEAIYGAGATLVRSQALVRVDIAMQTPPAIIAFGSRDPHMFNGSQGTELVSFLARVVERQFRTWLLLPN
jgi:uncharacterized protein YigA (DUF484 family)